jgi:hypothetical protein
MNVLPQNKVMGMLPYANMNDHIPMLNIMPFGMCSSIANPVVAAATAAAFGALTPMPCIPATPAPWTSAAQKVNIGTAPAITKDSTLMCMWGGQIQVDFPGQINVLGG